jgi:redox-sensitive bicupin YhaK (pirin superfamily)
MKMFNVRHKNDRGSTEIDWLKSRHSFSFGHYYDAANMGFGPLRVINEDWVSPGTGFDTHGHKNMEIITYVLEGQLAHKDSTGKEGKHIIPGEVQMMSAGKGILHSEYNGSATDTVHLLQIWIMPDEINTQPGYAQKPFAPEDMHNRLRLIVSNDGTDGSLVMKQDAKLYASRLDAGAELTLPITSDRKYWLQIARGTVEVQEQSLESGDALAVEKEQGTLTFKASTSAEVLLFDLPR